MVHEQLTEAIIGCAMKVANTLGCGFLEKVYENALLHELKKAGLGSNSSVRFLSITMVCSWGTSSLI